MSAEAFGVGSSWAWGSTAYFSVGEPGTLPCGRMLWLDMVPVPAQASLPAGHGALRPGMACPRQIRAGPVPSQPVLRDRMGSTGEKTATFRASAPPLPALCCRRPPQRCGSVPWGGAVGRLGTYGTAWIWDVDPQQEGPSRQPRYLPTGLVLDCWVLKSVQEPLNINKKKGLVKSN